MIVHIKPSKDLFLFKSKLVMVFGYDIFRYAKILLALISIIWGCMGLCYGAILDDQQQPTIPHPQEPPYVEERLFISCPKVDPYEESHLYIQRYPSPSPDYAAEQLHIQRYPSPPPHYAAEQLHIQYHRDLPANYNAAHLHLQCHADPPADYAAEQLHIQRHRDLPANYNAAHLHLQCHTDRPADYGPEQLHIQRHRDLPANYPLEGLYIQYLLARREDYMPQWLHIQRHPDASSDYVAQHLHISLDRCLTYLRHVMPIRRFPEAQDPYKAEYLRLILAQYFDHFRNNLYVQHIQDPPASDYSIELLRVHVNEFLNYIDSGLYRGYLPALQKGYKADKLRLAFAQFLYGQDVPPQDLYRAFIECLDELSQVSHMRSAQSDTTPSEKKKKKLSTTAEGKPTPKLTQNESPSTSQPSNGDHANQAGESKQADASTTSDDGRDNSHPNDLLDELSNDQEEGIASTSDLVDEQEEVVEGYAEDESDSTSGPNSKKKKKKKPKLKVKHITKIIRVRGGRGISRKKCEQKCSKHVVHKHKNEEGILTIITYIILYESDPEEIRKYKRERQAAWRKSRAQAKCTTEVAKKTRTKHNLIELSYDPNYATYMKSRKLPCYSLQANRDLWTFVSWDTQKRVQFPYKPLPFIFSLGMYINLRKILHGFF